MPRTVTALFSAHRADIETFAREMEAKGRARATVTRRLCTIAGFYKGHSHWCSVAAAD